MFQSPLFRFLFWYLLVWWLMMAVNDDESWPMMFNSVGARAKVSCFKNQQLRNKHLNSNNNKKEKNNKWLMPRRDQPPLTLNFWSSSLGLAQSDLSQLFMMIDVKGATPCRAKRSAVVGHRSMRTAGIPTILVNDDVGWPLMTSFWWNVWFIRYKLSCPSVGTDKSNWEHLRTAWIRQNRLK